MTAAAAIVKMPGARCSPTRRARRPVSAAPATDRAARPGGHPAPVPRVGPGEASPRGPGSSLRWPSVCPSAILIAEGAAASWVALQDSLGASENPGRRVRGLLPARWPRGGVRASADRRWPWSTVLVRPAGLGQAGFDVLGRLAQCGHRFAVGGAGFSCVIPQVLGGRADHPYCPGDRPVASVGYLGLVGGADRAYTEPGPAGRAGNGGRARALCRRVRSGPGPAGDSHGTPGQRNGSCPTGRITISLTSTAAGWPTAYMTAPATSAGASVGSA